jgi:hypothetical protein
MPGDEQSTAGGLWSELTMSLAQDRPTEQEARATDRLLADCGLEARAQRVPLSPFQPGMEDRFLPARVTLNASGCELAGVARIRSNGWLDVEIARPPSMAGLRSYPPHRVRGVEWLPEAWEPETGADGCQY